MTIRIVQFILGSSYRVSDRAGRGPDIALTPDQPVVSRHSSQSVPAGRRPFLRDLRLLSEHHSAPQYTELLGPCSSGSMGKQWRDGKGKYSQAQSPVQYWQGAWKSRQWQQQGTAPWRTGQEDPAWHWPTSSASSGAQQVFPRYDSKDPQLVVVTEKKSEEPGIVQTMQRAVTSARKAETRRRKLQADLEAKRRCWAGFQQELKTTFLKEQQRFQTDVLKLQEDIKEALLQEDTAKRQLVSQGDVHMEEIFPGMSCEGDMAPRNRPGFVDLSGRMLSKDCAAQGKGDGNRSHVCSAAALDVPCSPGTLDDVELRSMLQANSGMPQAQHSPVEQYSSGGGQSTLQKPSPVQHNAALVRAQTDNTPASVHSLIHAKSEEQAKRADQDPYQFTGGMTPSAPL